ncbi:hypothetical protein [Streptomyces sp. SID161]|uniref:hypothetical protein n=1 Tax=Streptomyces sp. SID161 TaxID=2690251 RepID=UPI00136BD6CE|nr:hypothetical protein [Streptomyces sp. SID161]MYW49637.1 hypothetical protein [Streptomyces sp. SID161]
MTLMTFSLVNGGFAGDPAHSIGRADAYDDAKTLTLEQLVVRAGTYADYHPGLAYAVGYMDHVIEIRLEQDVTAGAETELAWADRATTTATP